MEFKKVSKKLLVGILLIRASMVACAQDMTNVVDTLRIDLKQAEKVFLDSNLQLLAEYYNIESNKALVQQAKLWDNPVLNTDQNIYTHGKFFQHGNDKDGNPVGEYFVQVTQLIKTAGKRRKEINLAKTNVSIAEWQFKSVMRSLRVTLIKDYFTIAQLQGNADLYRQNLDRLTALKAAMRNQLAAGNIAQKEYLRVEALIIALQKDITDNDNNMADEQSELKTLLGIKGNVYIKPVSSEKTPTDMPSASIMQLIDSAKNNNSDYKLEVYQLESNKMNYKLQKAMAVPDLTIGTEFDQNANYTPNFYGLELSIPLPILNRNQGAIKSAGHQVKQEEANLKMADLKLQNDVLNAYQKLWSLTKMSNNDNDKFYEDYYKLFGNIVKSYNERQISMIEFLDYFNDYQDIREKQLQQQLDLRMAREALNDVVGIEILNLN
jgi:cobalt-zinc-cadmium efflux system outer membrane protein